MRANVDPIERECEARWGPSMIVVYPLKANRRPIGFAPWPEPEPSKTPNRKKRKKPTR